MTNSMIWKSQNGRETAITELNNKHLENIISKLERINKYGQYDLQLDVMKGERARRKLQEVDESDIQRKLYEYERELRSQEAKTTLSC